MPEANREVAAVILAAGKGTRMRSDRPKVLHELEGQPLIGHILGACREAGATRLVVVVGESEPELRVALGDSVTYVRQHQQLGTGDALKAAVPALAGFAGDLLVLVGDAPLIRAAVLRQLLALRNTRNHAAVVLTAVFDTIPPYGRIVRGKKGSVVRIVEEIDCTPEQKQIAEVLTGPYCFDAATVLPLLDRIKMNPQKGEYFLPDMAEILHRAGFGVSSLHAQDPRITLGINTPEDLALARQWFTELYPRGVEN